MAIGLSGATFLNPPSVEHLSSKLDQAGRVSVQLGNLAGPVVIEDGFRDQGTDGEDVGFVFGHVIVSMEKTDARRVQQVVRVFVEAGEEMVCSAQILVKENARLSVADQIHPWHVVERHLTHEDASAIAVAIKIILSQNSDVPLRRGISEQQTSPHGGLSFWGIGRAVNALVNRLLGSSVNSLLFVCLRFLLHQFFERLSNDLSVRV
jgi:hypothetical protein